jgi:hypothetical protein
VFLDPVMTEIADRFRSAVRTGRRLHLDQEHVQALLEMGIYEQITAREFATMRNTTCPPADTSLDDTGCISDRTPEHGSYAGSTNRRSAQSEPEESAEALSRGARQRVLQAVSRIDRPKPPSTRSRPTTLSLVKPAKTEKTKPLSKTSSPTGSNTTSRT